MRRQWFTAGIAVVVVFGTIFGVKWLQVRRAAATAAQMEMPRTAVASIIAEAAEWHPQVSVVGSLSAMEGTQVTAQIAGNITEIAFEAGNHVDKGALLVRLDDTTQRALLHANEARLTVARTTLERTRALHAADTASEAALQRAEADHATSLAAVEGDRATLAKLNITAPFAGIVGIREVSPGQYVSPGTPIVKLQNLTSLFLNFALPQNMLRDLAPGNTVHFTVDAYPGEIFAGTITALDSGIDPQTRNIGLQAVLHNPDGRLRPGLYGTVSLDVGAPLRGVSLPETTIAYSTFGNTVYVLEEAAADAATPGLLARARIITILANRDGQVLVGEGVEPGELVVAAGQNKLRDGAPVIINNEHPATTGS